MAYKYFFSIFVLSLLCSCQSPHHKSSLNTNFDFKQGRSVYLTHCSNCHGANRLGGMGPALIPINYERLSQQKALQSIREGVPATQMKGFKNSLTEDEIQSVLGFIFSDDHIKPEWTFDSIVNSKKNYPARPPIQVEIKDRMNVFAVVELAESSISFLDGSNWEVINSIKVQSNVHGGPKFSKDSLFMYYTSRDGWVGKVDLRSFELESTLRVGINTRNIALSTDGKYLAVANYLPHNIVILETATMSVVKIIDAISKSGISSRVSAVYTAPQRNSFIAGLKDDSEFFEISYNSEDFNKRSISTEVFMDDFFFDQSYSKIINSSRNHPGFGYVINIQDGKTIKKFPLSGMPHLGSGISFRSNEQFLMAIPNIKEGVLTILDTKNWNVVKEIKTPGPGFFVRSHPKSKYIWNDSLMSPHQDTMTVIDKRTLSIRASLTPEKGKTAAHIEYDKSGRYALLSLRDNTSGQILVYDTNNFSVVKSIPMKIPSGKYNIYNKINYTEGTSH